MFLSKKRTVSLRSVLSIVALNCWVLSAQAQGTSAAEPTDATLLKQVFETAWQRQPEARALQSRREAAQAQAKAADLLSPEAPSLEINQRSDEITGNNGVREAEVGIAVPLWLPGQRRASAKLAQAEISFVERRLIASQLRLASSVRDAWWAWQRTRVDAELAREQLSNARRLAADVARRVQAGDLARSDQHQAEGAVAAAEALSAQAQAATAIAFTQLAALTGGVGPSESTSSVVGEPLPVPSQPAHHPLLAALEDRIAVAERTANLISTQKRSNPELTVATTRDRGGFGERYGQTVFIGIRIPFGSGPRYDARIATAQAETIELQSQLILERDRIQADQRGAAARVEAARTQLNAAERRARLARESRGFFDKSFRLGETDLPTRLRIEVEAVEAGRQEARSRIDLAAAISAWRQSLGLLPQ
ncbi:TolC family protein [Parvibium lacunae]|uniref:TolC family protein n=1 Tax=Parvibium lacunae TaxID=1888893 RepID=A0A368L006_9BURK|nr:TolC family protein [Parvibium lacunae]RCS56880.1 TolC family protein [Parvibium lacunae]